MATQADSQQILNLQRLLAQKVARKAREDQLVRNRQKENEEKLKIALDLASELSTRALKSKNNIEYELLIKCSEIIQDYASGLVKDLINE